MTEIEKLKVYPREGGDPDIITVDTGGGEFDHHETGDKNKCASSLVLDYLVAHGFVSDLYATPLRRITDIVLEVDHFREIFWEKPDNDRYLFFLEEMIGGLKLLWQNQDARILKFGMEALDAVYQKMQFKVKAEAEIEKGMVFDAKGMRALALETINDEVLKLAQKKGFQVVIRRDPRKGYVRIKTIPNNKVDLTAVYSALQKKDRQATWFLHASKCIVLNGSTKNPNMVATKLQLPEIVDIVKANL